MPTGRAQGKPVQKAVWTKKVMAERPVGITPYVNKRLEC
jgi:hypothetical protein